MSTERNVPKLRFPGFTEPWEQRKLADVVDSVDTGKSKFDKEGSSGEYPILGSTSVIGYDDEYDYEGDFILTARVGANAGSLYRHTGKVKISDNTVFIQVSQNIEFLYQLLIRFDIKKLSFGTGQPLVKASELKSLELMMPTDMKEQMQIGEYFKSLDNLITLHQRKLKHVKDLKKSMLQKMFPKNGQEYPELRFPGFTEPWEQRKLGEYVSITSGEAPSKFEVGTELYVKVDDLNYNDKYVVDTQNKVAEHSTVKRVTKGSVVFPKRGAAIMTNKVRIMGIDGYMDTNMMALTSEKLDSEFLYNIISKEGLYKIADTSTIPQINNKHVEPYEVTIPSLDEQQKIGAYFKQLDHLITLHLRELEHLKLLKKGMLQQMFV